MSGVNKVILVGRVGKTPEIKRLQDNSIAKFTLATSESYKDKSGNKVQNTEWHDIEIWGKLADVVEKYVNKGDMLYIEGSIKTDTWENEIGEKQSRKKIKAKELTMLGGSKEQSANNAPATNYQTGTSVQDDTPDDLPF